MVTVNPFRNIEKMLSSNSGHVNRIHFSRSEYREEYLNSPEWRTKSKDFLNKNPKCLCCKNTATEVHHLSYRNLYNEKDNELLSICRNCHNYIHSHKELCHIVSKLKLIRVFQDSKKTWFLTPTILFEILNSDLNKQRRISSILKVNIRNFRTLRGTKVSYFVLCKVKRVLKMENTRLKFKKRGINLQEKKYQEDLKSRITDLLKDKSYSVEANWSNFSLDEKLEIRRQQKVL